MATPNTSMTATGLGNAEGGDGQPSMDINRELIETLDRYASTGDESKSPSDSPGQISQVESVTETPTKQETVEAKQAAETDVDEQSKQQTQSSAAEVMCS